MPHWCFNFNAACQIVAAMKKTFLLSLMVNLVLAGCLILIWHRSMEKSMTTNPKISDPASFLPAAASVNADIGRVQPAAFRWSQLDAPDYHVYVKNLRGIGCPEATIRAIV